MEERGIWSMAREMGKCRYRVQVIGGCVSGSVCFLRKWKPPQPHFGNFTMLLLPRASTPSSSYAQRVQSKSENPGTVSSFHLCHSHFLPPRLTWHCDLRGWRRSLMHRRVMLPRGEKIFRTKCAQCHTVDKGAGHKQGLCSDLDLLPVLLLGKPE
ncbi:hypothetical protein CK203_050275 [Vitis vinifera]|uniref:Cytochrome c domain-containing protein n=1 Tax=Vitis vinifera TaxID=29760 RepID=A0A438GZ10_VITVI|nr:hypothetical protein CK203_050275 [Vitis vinifera]